MITPPCLPSFLALPLSPHSPTSLTFSQRDYERNGVSRSTVTATSLPDAKSSKLQIIFPSAVVSGHQPTCLPNMDSTTTVGAPVAEGLPEETKRQWRLKKKNDRDRSTLTTRNSLRVHSSRVVDSRQNLDANQSN